VFEFSHDFRENNDRYVAVVSCVIPFGCFDLILKSNDYELNLDKSLFPWERKEKSRSVGFQILLDLLTIAADHQNDDMRSIVRDMHISCIFHASRASHNSDKIARIDSNKCSRTQ